jgi:hypothetical protein
MSKSLLLMLCLLTGLIVLACSKYETNRNVAAPAGTKLVRSGKYAGIQH